MTFLPLIERELRLRARAPAAYWTRFVVGLLGVFICLPQLTSLGTSATPAMIGRGVFNGLVSAGFLLICAACLLTVGALNDERREGTLDLLLLTRVRTLDVLLGKLGSMGLTSACVLLAFLPMLMLPLLSGGVSGEEVFRKGLGLLAALGFAMASGLFASACQQERLKAVGLAVLLVGAVVLAPFLAGVVFWRSGVSTAPPVPVRLSPVVLLISAGDLPYRASHSVYWTSLAMVIVLSGLLLAGACLRLRRALRGEAETLAPPAAASSENAQPAARPRGWQSVTGGASPVAWRVSRQRGLYASVWAAAVLGTLYHLLFGLISAWLGLRSVALASWSFSFASGAITASLCAWAASRFFVESRRTGELELLLTTPVGAQTIISEQWKVLKRVIRWPVAFMLLPLLLQGLVFFWMTASRFPQLAAYRLHYFVSLPFEVLSTILAMVALCWVSLWLGARAAGQARAILWSVAAARAIPYGVSVLFSIVVPLFLRSQPFSALSLWVSLLHRAVDAAYFVWLIRVARRRLPMDLATARPMHFDWRQVSTSRLRQAMLTFRAVRHWTPS